MAAVAPVTDELPLVPLASDPQPKVAEGNSVQPKTSKNAGTGVLGALYTREVVGRKLQVQRGKPARPSWERARVIDYDDQTNLHKIRLEDRSEEWVNLSDVKFRWEHRASRESGNNPTYREWCVGQAAVGRKLKIYWPAMGRWYQGIVKSYDSKTQLHRVKYRDGDIQDLALRSEPIIWEDDESESHGRENGVSGGDPGGQASEKPPVDCPGGVGAGRPPRVLGTQDVVKVEHESSTSVPVAQKPGYHSSSTSVVTDGPPLSINSLAHSSMTSRSLQNGEKEREEDKPGGKESPWAEKPGINGDVEALPEVEATSPGPGPNPLSPSPVKLPVLEVRLTRSADKNKEASGSEPTKQPSSSGGRKHRSPSPRGTPKSEGKRSRASKNPPASGRTSPLVTRKRQAEMEGVEGDVKRPKRSDNQPRQEPPKPPISSPMKSVVVGARIGVFWESDDTYYRGRVDKFSAKEMKYLIHYDDNEKEWVKLKQQKFEWYTPRGVSAGYTRQLHHQMVELGAQGVLQHPKQPAADATQASQPAPALDETAVGWQLSIFWGAMGAFVPGEVLAYNKGRHLVLYQDGEDEWLELAKETILWHSLYRANSLNKQPAGLLPDGKPPKGRHAVGWRVGIYWREDMEFYNGVIKEYDTSTGRHTILYDDDETEMVSLSGEKIVWRLPPTGPSHEADEPQTKPKSSVNTEPRSRKSRTSGPLELPEAEARSPSKINKDSLPGRTRTSGVRVAVPPKAEQVDTACTDGRGGPEGMLVIQENGVPKDTLTASGNQPRPPSTAVGSPNAEVGRDSTAFQIKPPSPRLAPALVPRRPRSQPLVLKPPPADKSLRHVEAQLDRLEGGSESHAPLASPGKRKAPPPLLIPSSPVVGDGEVPSGRMGASTALPGAQTGGAHPMHEALVDFEDSSARGLGRAMKVSRTSDPNPVRPGTSGGTPPVVMWGAPSEGYHIDSAGALGPSIVPSVSKLQIAFTVGKAPSGQVSGLDLSVNQTDHIPPRYKSRAKELEQRLGALQLVGERLKSAATVLGWKGGTASGPSGSNEIIEDPSAGPASPRHHHRQHHHHHHRHYYHHHHHSHHNHSSDGHQSMDVGPLGHHSSLTVQRSLCTPKGTKAAAGGQQGGPGNQAGSAAEMPKSSRPSARSYAQEDPSYLQLPGPQTLGSAPDSGIGSQPWVREHRVVKVARAHKSQGPKASAKGTSGVHKASSLADGVSGGQPGVPVCSAQVLRALQDLAMLPSRTKGTGEGSHTEQLQSKLAALELPPAGVLLSPSGSPVSPGSSPRANWVVGKGTPELGTEIPKHDETGGPLFPPVVDPLSTPQRQNVLPHKNNFLIPGSPLVSSMMSPTSLPHIDPLPASSMLQSLTGEEMASQPLAVPMTESDVLDLLSDMNGTLVTEQTTMVDNPLRGSEEKPVVCTALDTSQLPPLVKPVDPEPFDSGCLLAHAFEEATPSLAMVVDGEPLTGLQVVGEEGARQINKGG